MTAAFYWWRATRRQTWRPALAVLLLCGLLGAVSMGALAGARTTESAYGQYLRSVKASDVAVNIPAPGTALVAKVSALPGISTSAAWLGLSAEPMVHGRADDAFAAAPLTGSFNGEFFRQDTMTVLQGRLPRVRAPHEVALTAGVARLFGVGVGGSVTYQFEDNNSSKPKVTGYASYRVVGIVELPPALVDQFDQAQATVLSPAATTSAIRHRNSVAFSWVDARLVEGSAGVAALQSSLTGLAHRLGGGIGFEVRQLDTVHQQVQEAIRPQAVALAVFGALAALALLVLLSQSLAQLLDRSATQMEILGVLGLTRAEAAMASAMGGAMAIVGGIVLAGAGAVALSPLAPVGPVRGLGPARGLHLDVTVVLGGGAVLAGALLGLLAGLAWRSARPRRQTAPGRPSAMAKWAGAIGLPAPVGFGATFALERLPGRRQNTVRATLGASIVALVAVVSAVVFGASLNGLVAHPARYGWNWDLMVQSQGGYGDWYGFNMDKLMAAQPGVRGWSTFGFTQLDLDGQSVPVLGLATHGAPVEPPTISGHAVDGPNDIEVGEDTLHQLGKQIGGSVTVAAGGRARRMTIVGTVTLPSVGVSLTDHISLGRGAMLPEGTLLALENLKAALASGSNEAFTALPSTLVIDLDRGASGRTVLDGVLRAEPDGTPGGMYQVHRVLSAAVVNDVQMGRQPLALAITLVVAVMLSLLAAVLASARQRRRDLAVLKALGLTPRQVAAILVWQTSTILVIATVLGLPLGLAAGHWVWTSFAASIGVVPVTVMPFGLLVLGLVVLLTAGSALTALPAALASRAPTASTLRSE